MVLVFTASHSYAQEGGGKTLNHVTLVVSDFEASREFYVELLGLETIDAPWLPERQMFLALGENLELHIGEVEGVEVRPSRFNHVSIAVDKFDEFLEYLRSAGIVYTQLGGGEDYFVSTRPDNARQTWITDPDGYWIEIIDVTNRQ